MFGEGAPLLAAVARSGSLDNVIERFDSGLDVDFARDRTGLGFDSARDSGCRTRG
jgi:hypothetical protein